MDDVSLSSEVKLARRAPYLLMNRDDSETMLSLSGGRAGGSRGKKDGWEFSGRRSRSGSGSRRHRFFYFFIFINIPQSYPSWLGRAFNLEARSTSNGPLPNPPLSAWQCHAYH